MSTNHNPDPPPGARESSKATAGASSRKPHIKISQAPRKFTKSAAKKISKPLKHSRNRVPVAHNEGASLNQNIEDTLLQVSTNDQHPAMSENLSVCANRGPSGEPASQIQATPSAVQEDTDLQPADDELRDAHEAQQYMDRLGKRATDVASAAQDGPADLAAADDVQTTYLQPLIFDTAIEKLSNIHPYAKMALGVLSAASKIILAQAEHDKSMNSLLKKLDEVYHFMTEDGNLDKIESMHDIVGQIVQQTVVCARFIRDSSNIKNFWMRLKKNVVSSMDDAIPTYRTGRSVIPFPWYGVGRVNYDEVICNRN